MVVRGCVDRATATVPSSASGVSLLKRKESRAAPRIHILYRPDGSSRVSSMWYQMSVGACRGVVNEIQGGEGDHLGKCSWSSSAATQLRLSPLHVDIEGGHSYAIRDTRRGRRTADCGNQVRLCPMKPDDSLDLSTQSCVGPQASWP